MNLDFTGKKLLVLGGKPIGSCEIVNFARSHNAYVIVADYLPKEESAAKKIADESWDVSTNDLETLVRRCKEEKVDGVYTGVHEFNINKTIELCNLLGKPCFCTPEQWEYFDNKRLFKQICQKNDVPVTKEYVPDSLEDREVLAKIEYPVIVKPVDGSGSRGFAICRNEEELRANYPQAAEFSPTQSVLIEKYMNYVQSVIINYTIIDGVVCYCGMSDKRSKKVFDTGAPVMAVQFYPSIYEQKYLDELNERVKGMFKSIGLQNGVVWIEAFCDEGKFTFNEAGYRFGGSLTYLPVNYFFNYDQLAIQVNYALTGNNSFGLKYERRNLGKTYCILPIHVKPGTITRLEGFDKLESREELVRIVPVHFPGDTIQNWGSAQQVFAYLHFAVDSRKEANDFIQWINSTLKVYDNETQLLFNLYDSEMWVC